MKGVEGREQAEEFPDKDCITRADHVTRRRSELDLGDGSRVPNECLRSMIFQA